MEENNKLITVAIHTYERALQLKAILEKGGVSVTIHNVDLEMPKISTGVRVRINEKDLPLALKIIEESTSFTSTAQNDKKRKSTQNILIPIDFSDYSYKACKLGFEYAEMIGAEVTILNTYVSSNYSGSLPFKSDKFIESIIEDDSSDKELIASLNRKMQHFTLQIKESIAKGEIANVKFNTMITEGVPEDAILLIAKQIKAQLIVMATRGKDKKEMDLIGSVTAEVLDAGKFPVFTVPENINLSSINDIQNVAFFSNLCQEDLISFDLFTRLFFNYKLNVTIITLPDKNLEKINARNKAILEYCKTNYPNYTFEIKTIPEPKFIDVLNSYNDKLDLIIIPNKKKNIFARLYSPSIAHKLLFHSDTPILAVPI